MNLLIKELNFRRSSPQLMKFHFHLLSRIVFDSMDHYRAMDSMGRRLLWEKTLHSELAPAQERSFRDVKVMKYGHSR